MKKIIPDSKNKDMIIEQLKVDKDNIEKDLATAENSWKELNRTLKKK